MQMHVRVGAVLSQFLNRFKSGSFQDKKTRIWPLVLLEALTAFFYGKSLWFPFQFDDVAHITKRFAIRHDNPLNRWWYNRRWFGDWLNNLNHKVSLFDPFVYRLTNLAFHMVSGALLYFIVLTMCRSIENSVARRYQQLIAFTTAGLFLLHPLQTQAVSYVIQGRIEGVASFFILLNLFLFIRYTQAKTRVSRISFLVVLLVSTVIACGTKEIFVVTPLLMGAIDLFFLNRGSFNALLKERWLFYLGYGLFFGALVAWYVLDFSNLRIVTEAGRSIGFQTAIQSYMTNQNNLGNILTENPNVKISSMLYMMSQFKALLHYIWIVFVPTSMSVEYDWMLVSNFWRQDVIVPLIALMGMLALSIYSVVKRRFLLAGFGMVWFFIVSLPRSSFIPSAELVCDYKTYLAVVGVYMFIAVVFAGILDWVGSKDFKYAPNAVYVGVLAFLFIPLGGLTYMRNLVWSSNVLFWEDCVKKAPGKARVHNNYGVALSEAGRIEESLPYYEKAMNLDPQYQDPVNNYSVACSMLGHYDNAIRGFKRIIEMYPNYAEAYNNLGSILIEKKDYAAAEEMLNKAIEKRDHYGKAYFNLARLAEERGDYQKLWENLKMATTMDLDCEAEAFEKLGLASVKLQKFDEAEKAFERGLKLRESDLAWFNYANVLYFQKQYQKSMDIYSKLVAKSPQDYRYINNLAETHFALGQYDKALERFSELTRQKKYQGEVIFRISACFEKMKNFEEAKAILAKYNDDKVPDFFKKQIHTEMARIDIAEKVTKNKGITIRQMEEAIKTAPLQAKSDGLTDVEVVQQVG